MATAQMPNVFRAARAGRVGPSRLGHARGALSQGGRDAIGPIDETRLPLGEPTCNPPTPGLCPVRKPRSGRAFWQIEGFSPVATSNC